MKAVELGSKKSHGVYGNQSERMAMNETGVFGLHSFLCCSSNCTCITGSLTWYDAAKEAGHVIPD